MLSGQRVGSSAPTCSCLALAASLARCCAGTLGGDGRMEAVLIFSLLGIGTRVLIALTLRTAKFGSDPAGGPLQRTLAWKRRGFVFLELCAAYLLWGQERGQGQQGWHSNQGQGAVRWVCEDLHGERQRRGEARREA